MVTSKRRPPAKAGPPSGQTSVTLMAKTVELVTRYGGLPRPEKSANPRNRRAVIASMLHGFEAMVQAEKPELPPPYWNLLLELFPEPITLDEDKIGFLPDLVASRQDLEFLAKKHKIAPAEFIAALRKLSRGQRFALAYTLMRLDAEREAGAGNPP